MERLVLYKLKTSLKALQILKERIFHVDPSLKLTVLSWFFLQQGSHPIRRSTGIIILAPLLNLEDCCLIKRKNFLHVVKIKSLRHSKRIRRLLRIPVKQLTNCLIKRIIYCKRVFPNVNTVTIICLLELTIALKVKLLILSNWRKSFWEKMINKLNQKHQVIRRKTASKS